MHHRHSLGVPPRSPAHDDQRAPANLGNLHIVTSAAADLPASFEDAWTSFQTTEMLSLAGDPGESEWTRGRAQYLIFLIRIEDSQARQHLARVAERLAEIPGVEPFPDWYWHITVKGAGFQVIKRVHEDDVLREDVPRIAGKARALLAREEAFDVQLGLSNAFAAGAFLEAWDNDLIRQLNTRLMEGMPETAHDPFDGAAFLPHVSIARFTSNDGLEELKDALARLRAEGPGPSFPVRRVEFAKAWLSEEISEVDVRATYALRSPP